MMPYSKRWRVNQNSITKFIFFGNYFYGLCAVALSIEANLQQHYPLNKTWFYVLIFAGTIFYYTIAYINVGTTSRNKRLIWYAENRRFIKRSQLFFFLICLLLGARFVIQHFEAIFQMPWHQWLIILFFPVIAGFYYGIGLKPGGKINLRSIGWLKPFIIGLTWAGLVTVYPVMVVDIENDVAYQPTLISLFLFIKNLMFVSVLCIMFDIKDYADDYNQNLKTFVTQFGLRRTIFNILLPLSILGLGSFLWYGYTQHFSAMKVMMNTIPFIAMITVAYSMSSRQNIFYYLIIIDGLMLLKAIFGILGVVYF